MATRQENAQNHVEEQQTITTEFDSDFRTVAIDSNHPLYLHPSDNPGQVLVSSHLSGDNFNEWKRLMSLVLSAKNKLGIVTGKYKIPDKQSPYFDHWQRCNDMIITWILNTIIPEIRSSLVYVTIAADMWNDLHVRFNQNNGPRIFELKKELSALVQENLSISAYYTRFKKLYDELLNVSQAPRCICPCNCKAKLEIEQYDEVMKVTQFLVGLNNNFTNIRGQLLMMDSMPKLTQALALLQQEERQRCFSNSTPIESAALMSKQAYKPGNSGNFGTKFVRPDARKNEATTTQDSNHTKERCSNHSSRFSVNSDRKMIAQVQSSQSESSLNMTNLSATQFQQLLHLLNHSHMTVGSTTPPQSGTSKHTCKYITVGSESGWVEVRTQCDHLGSLSSDLTHIPTPDTPCYRCQHPSENWLCLCCKEVLCSRYVNKHMREHCQQSNHCLALGYSNLSVWCFSCDAYLDAQVILSLRPVYETAYILKFGEAPPFPTVDLSVSR